MEEMLLLLLFTSAYNFIIIFRSFLSSVHQKHLNVFIIRLIFLINYRPSCTMFLSQSIITGWLLSPSSFSFIFSMHIFLQWHSVSGSFLRSSSIGRSKGQEGLMVISLEANTWEWRTMVALWRDVNTSVDLCCACFFIDGN